MKKPPVAPTDAAALRRRAEQQLPAEALTQGADADMHRLLHELQVHQIELEMQNEELHRAKVEVDTLLARYTELYDFAPVGYFALDREGMIRQVNFTGAKILGVERGKLNKRRLASFIAENDRSVFSEFLGRVFAGQTSEACDLTLICTDNTPRLVHIKAGTEETGQTCRVTVTDITEFRAAQQQLAHQLRQIEDAELEWESVFDSVLDPVFLHDKEFNILRCNKAYQQCAGLPFKQIIGRPYYEIFPKTGAPLPCCLRAMEKAEEEEEEEEEVTVGDASYRSRSFYVRDKQGIYLYSVHILEDITERRETETAFRALVGAAAANIGVTFFHETVRSLSAWLGLECVIVGEIVDGDRVRALAMQLDGKAIEHYEYALPSTPCDSLAHKGYCVYPEGVCQLFPTDKDLIDMGAESYVGTPVRDSNGKVNGILCAISRHKLALPPMTQGVFEIIAARAGTEIERKRAEAAVEHANRALAALSAVNRSLVRARGEEELLQAICRSIVEQRDYRLAWVGYVQHDANKSIRIMAHAGQDNYLENMPLTWAEAEHGMTPSGRAVHNGATQLCQDIANDPQFLPWRDEALKCGCAAAIALPLKGSDNKVFGLLHVYADAVNAFAPAEVFLLEEMADDLAFGINMLHVRRERDLALTKNQEQVLQLENNLEDTMQAITGIVEMRDPYTAGHQQRVAQLATAIAVEMKLPEEQVHGIHLASTVHDLGKIQVPAEMLSKPGKLSEIEYSLIKVHPQAGYDILKGINFPWPIAQIVLQHHERIDGSGYPQGLKGEAILLEARILAVADVVEAISAHRPYRVALGEDAALEEIARSSGTFYDPQVVDACLKLFREQDFHFM